jgi:DNA-binding response OmpR family regulator
MADFPGKTIILRQQTCSPMSAAHANSSPPSPEGAAGRIRVLVIDDDRKLCRLIQDYLEPMGYEIAMAHTGPVGVERAAAGAWHAVILDVMLPGLDGFEVLKQIRRASDVPVLMLTARGEEADRIVGLEIGADDYLPKTFSTRELLARLRAVIRRTGRPSTMSTAEPGKELVVGQLRVNPDTRIAVLGDQPLALTPVEFDLLASLARNRGRVKTRESLLEEIRDRHYDVYDRSIDVHIAALRRKLGDDAKNPRFIRTLRAAGYMLINPDAE